MVDNFDITMTATLRPELLEVTLKSFQENLFKEHLQKARLIINIDFVGGSTMTDNAIRYSTINNIIKQFPFREVKRRCGFKPHFSTAFLWCMKQIETPFFFHLEEDWRLDLDLNFEDMWKLFIITNLVHLRLSQFKSEEWRLKNWNKFLNWNGYFFQVPADERGVIGWCGHPALNRTSFIQKCLPFIDPEHNPEKQIKGRRYQHPVNTYIQTSIFGSFHPKNTQAAIVDIGRNWMVENGWRKAGNKAWFQNWERSND